MLSMKTLRVAIAVVGSAVLLLGSGFAAATVQHLDGTPAPGTPTAKGATLRNMCRELLTEGTGQALTAPKMIRSPRPHTMHKLVVGIGRLIERATRVCAPGIGRKAWYNTVAPSI